MALVDKRSTLPRYAANALIRPGHPGDCKILSLADARVLGGPIKSGHDNVGESGFADEGEPVVFGDDLDAEQLGVGELGAGAGTGDDDVGFL